MMDGRGGCCIAPYAAGVYDMSKVDRIMLRFRPIAPKPAAGGSVSGGSSPENSEVNVKSSGRGKKRRYVKHGKKTSTKRGCGNNKIRRKSSSDETDPCSGGSVTGGDPAVTLALLPETPDRKDSPATGSPKENQTTIWLNFGDKNDNSNNKKLVNDNQERLDIGHVYTGLDRTALMTPQPMRLVGSIVTVECVTDTCVDAYGLGWKDEERMRNLEEDACPGFVSDGYNRVGWINGAYREMVGGEVVVWLVMKERVPITYPAFTCKVKVQHTCGKERSSVVVPCDVWKMDGGGFAWRLDVKAALSLGR